MLPPDMLHQIRRIELSTRKLVEESFAGAYHSVFKGRGMEFDAVRPYEPGDDIRSIDWNVTARVGEPFVKRYVEERELTVMVALDTSASLMFGTVKRQKRDLAAEMGAVLAFSAIRNNDKAGLLLFSDQMETYVPPRKGRNHILRLIRELLAAQPAHHGTNLPLALQTVNRLLKRRAIIFLISDFLAADYERDLALTARYHDLIPVVLSDPRERTWPDTGLVALQDVETGVLSWIDTSDDGWRTQFEAGARQREQRRDAAFAGAGLDFIRIASDGNYVQALTAFFQGRLRRLRR